MTLDLKGCTAALDRVRPYLLRGKVSRITGLAVESHGPVTRVGDVCHIWPQGDFAPVVAEVVGFGEGKVTLLPLGPKAGIAPGCFVDSTGRQLEIGVGPALLGRVIDAMGCPMDGGPPLRYRTFYPLANEPPPPMARRLIDEPLGTGVRSVDGLLTCGRGQRMGIFSGSGVGKSTLLAMIARNTEADVTVIALVGERGRELREFVARDLGPEGLRRSVVVAATSDQPPLLRMKAAEAAVSIAEYFRDTGAHVMLLMDSLTRYALAAREVGLAAGEPPATRGFPPSAFSLLPRLLERCGTGPEGSITGFFTVLVEGDDFNEPVADTARSILDGHIILDRRLAAHNHYPPVEVMNSVSRLMPIVSDAEHRAAAGVVRELLAVYRDAEDLINIGAYKPGSSPAIDRAVSFMPQVNAFLRQAPEETHDLAGARRDIIALAAQIQAFNPAARGAS